MNVTDLSRIEGHWGIAAKNMPNRRVLDWTRAIGPADLSPIHSLTLETEHHFLDFVSRPP